MGRKIPGKKHRGVKDPTKQQLQNKEKLKLLINRPPTNPDIQEIPKTVIEMNRLRELVKNGKFNNKKKKKGNAISTQKPVNGPPQFTGSNQNKNSWPSLRQKSGESDASYLWRIDKATNKIINEVKIEVKHDVEVNKNNMGMGKSITPKIIDTPEKNWKNNKKSNKNGETDYLLDRKERMKLRRKLKLKTKKLNKIKLSDDAIEKKKDVIAFGEVAHQPPQLCKRPKGCKVEKPGCKPLLLKSMFSTKDKSMAEIKQLTEERDKVLKAYEEMKLRNKSQVKHKWT